MTVTTIVRLDGDDVDLATLRVLTFSCVCHVGRDTRSYYLDDPRFEEKWPAYELIWPIADSVVRRLNGLGRLHSASYRPVRVGRFLYNDAENGTSVGRVGVAVERSSALPLEPKGPHHWAGRVVEAAAKSDELTEALSILGVSAQQLDWFDLYKVFEVIRDDIAGQRDASPSKLLEVGLISRDDLGRFLDAANNRATSGDASRHARGRSARPHPRPMRLPEADALIRSMANAWIDRGLTQR